MSKVIFDAPELLEESLVNLTEACRYFPGSCSRPTLERWLRKGVRGTVLESVLIGGKRYTSEEAIGRFKRNQLQVEPDRAEPRRDGMSKRDLAKGCRKHGLPELLEGSSPR